MGMMGWGGGMGTGWGGGGRWGGMTGGRLRSARDADEEDLLGAPYNQRVVGRLARYLGPYKLQMAVATVALVIYSLTVLAQPYLIRTGIDDHIVPGDIGGLTWLALVFVAVAALSWLTQWGQQVLLANVGQGILYTLRNELFSHLQKLSLSFFDRQQSGRIISRVQSDVNQLQELVTGGLLTSIGDMLVLVGIVVVLASMNWQLALVTFTVLPLGALLMNVWQRFAVSNFRRVRRAISEVNSGLQENISGVRVIQALSREDENNRRFDQVNTQNLNANLRASRLSAAIIPGVEIVTAIATALVIVYGGSLVLGQSLTPGELVAFVLYIQRFFDPVRDLSLRYTQLQAAMVSGERIFELLDVQPAIVDAPNARALPRVAGRVTFDHVWFEYLPERPILKGLNLDVAPGETIALVGPTGAGKSTIVGLIPRFYDVTSGSIRIDGVDVRDVTVRSLRRNIGLVLQEPYLFSGTIAQNLRFGKPTASDEELWAALETVGLVETVRRLRGGLEAELGERGVNLSLGQRQLVSFARALLADPRILILDEATANIDTHTERLIKQAMGSLVSGRTSFIIAHRLATIRDADRIAVIDGGQIVELGSHEELLALRGKYYDLYTMATAVVPDAARAQRRAAIPMVTMT